MIPPYRVLRKNPQSLDVFTYHKRAQVFVGVFGQVERGILVTNTLVDICLNQIHFNQIKSYDTQTATAIV